MQQFCRKQFLLFYIYNLIDNKSYNFSIIFISFNSGKFFINLYKLYNRFIIYFSDTLFCVSQYINQDKIYKISSIIFSYKIYVYIILDHISIEIIHISLHNSTRYNTNFTFKNVYILQLQLNCYNRMIHKRIQCMASSGTDPSPIFK